jgi:WD40 repeat protein
VFHTAASNILASAGGVNLKVWDLNTGESRFSVVFPDVVHSASWKSDGSIMTTTCKDKKIRTIDPRTGTFAQEVDGHTGVKASSSIWLGKTDQLLSTGFNKVWLRHLCSSRRSHDLEGGSDNLSRLFSNRAGKGSSFCGILAVFRSRLNPTSLTLQLAPSSHSTMKTVPCSSLVERCALGCCFFF